MAEFTLWTPEEMQDRAKPKRAQQREARDRAIAEYSAFFASAQPGYGGQLVLGDDEDKRKIRALVREAASRNNLSLRFRPIKDKNRIEFLVIDPEKQPSRRNTGARRGRPKKNQ
ncbi:MAG TPA: hypothetical protein VD886_21865 [Herpetosiphonaceae bacterium]|nr:hypothetical protein [Herpetosiphonaceae bacterium]